MTATSNIDNVTARRVREFIRMSTYSEAKASVSGASNKLGD